MNHRISRSQVNKIRSMLVARGISQKSIALELSVSLPTVNTVISGKVQSRRIKAHIAKLLKIDPQKLWGKAV